MRLLAPCIAVLLLAGIVQAADPAKPAERTEAEKAAMAKLREAGALVLEVAQNDPHLEVAFHLQPANFDEASLDQVQSLKNQVVQLNLRGVKVSDAALAKLADMPALTHLHLEKTPVTDAGLVHLKGLQNLVYLNLYGTAVTDAGLGSLAGLKNLKRIYLWETKVTDAGAEALTKALPEIRIDRGLVVSIQTPVEEKKEEAKPDEKKDDKKTEEKKEEKKPDDKKAEEKKPDEKKPEEKKAEEKK